MSELSSVKTKIMKEIGNSREEIVVVNGKLQEVRG